MSDQFQFDAFLSHNSQEQDAVKVIADRLRRLDSPIKVWLDEWELIPGRSSVEGIEDGIKQSLTFVLFLGPAGLGPWHQIERRAALFHERDSRGLVTIIPVLLPGIEQPKESVPLLLRDPTWVVFKSINPLDEEALHLLVCGIRGEKPGKFQHRMSNEIIDSNQQIVPRGLRSFTDRDSSYFLRLLPGPREKGLPLSISFWKEKLEEVDPDKTFRIGLLHGPSGCGKSSLVKAGLLPRLAEYVHAIYLEATPDDTESQLLAKLRKQFPELPVDLDLPATLQTLRENPQLASGSKVVLILDQFEQWLHAKRIDDSTPLVQALRYCDGRVLQAVVMVRVDYHLETYRFFKQFDGVKIQDGINTQLVDLFDRNHASKVLLEFGRAYDRIADPGKLTAEEPSFLTEVLDQLQDKDQRLIAVQLALFADLMKDKPWTGEILKKLGGATGVGRAYLEEKFDSKMANPTHKRHRKAAIAILKELLPPRGAEIKGTSRTRSQLIAATEYTARLQDFDELIQILQNDLKLIAPAALDEDATEERPEPSFQLIHDYLVPSLRDWLTATDRESWSGRARILIEERTADWLRDNENPRHSLTPWQWLSIQCGVSKRKRSEDANRLLRRSIRRFSTQTAIVVSVLLGPVVAYFGSEFFTFQASFDSREYDGQRREIIITKRFDPRPAAWQFRQGTWIFKDDLKDRESEDKVNNLILNSGLSPDWSPLVPLLNYSRLSIAELEWLDRPISAQAAYLDSKDLAVWNRIEPDRVTTALVALLKDQDNRVRVSAAEALVRLGRRDSDVIELLVVLIKDQDSDIRARAAESLGQLGSSDANVVEVLVAMLKDQDSDVRLRSAEALLQLGRRDSDVIEVLVALLKDQNPIQLEAVESLVQLGISDANVIETLVALLKDQDNAWRASAAETSGQLGISDSNVIETLEALLRDRDQTVRLRAAESLLQLGRSDANIIEALVALVKDQLGSVRLHAAQTLSKLDRIDANVIDALTALLKDQKSDVRLSAAETLVQLGRTDANIVVAIKSLFKDQNTYFRIRAAESLVKLGSNDATVIEALVAMLNDQHGGVRDRAANALGILSQGRTEWTDERMIADLTDNDSSVRERAGIVLAYRHQKVGDNLPDRKTVERIKKLREPGNAPWVKQAALYALYHIEKRKAELEEAAKTPSTPKIVE